MASRLQKKSTRGPKDLKVKIKHLATPVIYNSKEKQSPMYAPSFCVCYVHNAFSKHAAIPSKPMLPLLLFLFLARATAVTANPQPFAPLPSAPDSSFLLLFLLKLSQSCLHLGHSFRVLCRFSDNNEREREKDVGGETRQRTQNAKNDAFGSCGESVLTAEKICKGLSIEQVNIMTVCFFFRWCTFFEGILSPVHLQLVCVSTNRPAAALVSTMTSKR